MKKNNNYVSLRLFLMLSLMLGLTSCDGRFDAENWPAVKATDKFVTPDPPAYPYSSDAIAIIADTLWVHSGEYFFRSADGGNSWSHIALPKRIKAVGMRASPDGQRIMLFGRGGELVQSRDSGETWNVVELARALDGLDEEYSYAEEDFWVDKGLFDKDLKKMLVVAICHVFVSEDLGNTWRLITPAKSFPKSGRREYCAYDVAVDNNFEPTHIAAEMTGSITTGDYVLRRAGDKWANECTYDPTLLLFDVAADCGKLGSAPQTSQFNEYNEDVIWAEDNNLVDKIFDKDTIEYPEGFSLKSLPYMIADRSAERTWAFTYKGIARTTDQGQSWTTLAGGLGAIDHEALFPNGQRLAISRNKLYRSEDGTRWQLDDSITEPYNLISTTDGAVLLAASVWVIKDSQSSAKLGIELSAHELFVHENTVWAYNDDVLATSVDGGLNWTTMALDHNAYRYGWMCADTCIYLMSKDEKTIEVLEVELLDGKLSVNMISSINIGENIELSDYQADPTLKTWYLEGYDYEADDSSYYRWASFDRARTWQKIQSHGDESSGVIFHANSSLTFATPTEIHTVQSGPDAAAVTPLPNLELGEVCTTDTGLSVVTVYDEHPEAPGDHFYSILYSETAGREWYTTFAEHDVCEE